MLLLMTASMVSLTSGSTLLLSNLLDSVRAPAFPNCCGGKQMSKSDTDARVTAASSPAAEPQFQTTVVTVISDSGFELRAVLADLCKRSKCVPTPADAAEAASSPCRFYHAPGEISVQRSSGSMPITSIKSMVLTTLTAGTSNLLN